MQGASTARQVPITPPSILVITSVAERGTPPPSGQRLAERAGREVRRGGRRARVLDVDEHRRAGPAWSIDAGDLLADRAGQEAADLAGVGIGAPASGCCRRARARRCSARSRRCRSGSRAGRRRRTTGRPGRRRCCPRRSALPAKVALLASRRRRCTKRSQAKRVAAWSSPSSRQRMIWPKSFARARVGRVDLGLGAAAVVGQREVDLAASADRPRPIPGRSILVAPDVVGGEAGVDQDVGLVGEAVLRPSAPFWPGTSASQSPVPSSLNRAT